jgi:long-chain fatty acid transport protein
MTSMYLSLAGAYRLPDLGLSLGLALNGVLTRVHTIRARNTDGTDDLVDADKEDALKEGRTELKASGTDLALGVGVIYEPAQDVWVGVSFQTRPGISGEQSLEGELRQALLLAPTNTSKIKLVQGLADILRIGYRQRFGSKWEVRAQAELAFWNAMKRQCILNEGVDDSECKIGENGKTDSDFIANLERQWEDAWGGRVGLSRFVSDDLELFGGVGYDASAIPSTFMDPALFDLDKYTVSLGGLYDLSESLALSATFTQVIYLEQDTSGDHKPPTMAPSSVGPDAGGTYKQAISVLNLGLLAKF